MTKELRYVNLSDGEAIEKTEKRLKQMKKLLAEIRDALKAAGGVE